MLIHFWIKDSDIKIIFAKTARWISHLVLSYDFKDWNEPMILDNAYNGKNSVQLKDKVVLNEWNRDKKIKKVYDNLDLYLSNNDNWSILNNFA